LALRSFAGNRSAVHPKRAARKGYNVRVAAPIKSDPHKEHRHATYASETAGLLLVAFLLLVLTLIRYWHNIHWSWR